MSDSTEQQLRDILAALILEVEAMAEDVAEPGQTPHDVMCACVGASPDHQFPAPCPYCAAKRILQREDVRKPRISILDLNPPGKEGPYAYGLEIPYGFIICDACGVHYDPCDSDRCPECGYGLNGIDPEEAA